MTKDTGNGSDPPGRRDLLAHDLRAALTDVMGGLRLLDQEPLSEGARAQVERAQVSGELMARLLEDVLGETGASAASLSVDLRRLIEDEMKRWRGAALPQGIAVRRNYGPGIPTMLQVNALSLRRILANAMGNAVRYAKSEIILCVEMIEGDEICIMVEDDGPGFDPESLPLTFAPSQRGAESHGTGMGLHIASKHAADMGGRLLAGNRETGGAYVSLCLPDSLSAGPALPLREIADLTGWRVLVADDSETLRVLLTGMLSQLGAECEWARDGIVALNWLARERFDLALLDVEMPLLGGREVIRAERLRQARGIAPPTPLIALTAHMSDEIREALLDDGADGVLFKPVPDTESFGRMLAGIIDLQTARPEWQPEAAPILSAATLSELMLAAGPKNAEEMLTRMKEDLKAVETDFQAALDTGNLDEIRFQSHIIVSLAGAVGALPTLSLARRMSELSRDGDMDAMRITGQVTLARLRELRGELDGVG